MLFEGLKRCSDTVSDSDRFGGDGPQIVIDRAGRVGLVIFLTAFRSAHEDTGPRQPGQFTADIGRILAKEGRQLANEISFVGMRKKPADDLGSQF